MFQSRYRNRNALVDFGKREIKQFGGNPSQTCTVSPSWFTAAISGQVILPVVIETMDDVAGDPPPRRKRGQLSGPRGTKREDFRFHPMTKVKAEVKMGNPLGWTIRHSSQVCPGQAGAANVLVQRVPSGATELTVAGLALPMVTAQVDNQFRDYLDMRFVPFPTEQAERLRALTETACTGNRGKVGETNLYESLAEVDKTFGMLKDILERARRIQTTMFKGVKGSTRLRSFTNEAAGQYLATRYGFMPTLKDADAILVGLETPLGNKAVSTRAKESWKSETKETLTDFVDSGLLVFTREKTTRHELIVRSVSVDSVEITRLGALGLGYKDLWSLPLELVSYSFVADWFANLQDAISSFAPDIGVSNIGQCTTIEWNCVETVEYKLKGIAPGAGSDVEIQQCTTPGPVVRTIHYKSRDTGPFPELPRLRWKTDFKFVNPLRCLDSLALFANAAAKIKANLIPSSQELALATRRRTPSQKGVRSSGDFVNLTDRK